MHSGHFYFPGINLRTERGEIAILARVGESHVRAVNAESQINRVP